MPSWLQIGYEIEPKGTTPKDFRQVHGSTVLCLDLPTRGGLPDADAGYTTLFQRTVAVTTADCLPILFYTADRSGPIAATHAGWRGALAGIAQQTLSAMKQNPETVFAHLGPSIGPCCFEIQSDFIEAFENAGRTIRPYLQIRGNRTFCDLLSFVREQELQNLPHRNLNLSAHRCTVCSSPTLPSYRRNGKADPLIRSWIRKT